MAVYSKLFVQTAKWFELHEVACGI